LHGEQTLSSPVLQKDYFLAPSLADPGKNCVEQVASVLVLGCEEFRKRNKSRKVDYFLAPSLANRRYITFEAQGDVLLTREG
jgi:hypothetical protein